MFDRLVLHGCADMSSSMDPDGYSSDLIAAGGFGDVWRGLLKDGTVVAVKSLRLYVISQGEKKAMKVRTLASHSYMLAPWLTAQW